MPGISLDESLEFFHYKILRVCKDYKVSAVWHSIYQNWSFSHRYSKYLTVIRHYRQLDHKRSCKRRNKDYKSGRLSCAKKTICEAINESQCFFVDENNGINRHKGCYQKNKEKMKNSAKSYQSANRENVNEKRREKYCKNSLRKKVAQG